MAHVPGTHIALLRGINLLQHNRLPMRALADLFTAAGCGHVATYIQSGNVVFRSSRKSPARIAAEVAESIAKQYGFNTKIVLRSADELTRIVETNPFLAENVPSEHLHVVFLQEVPSRAAADALTPKPGSQDRFRVQGREVYLYLPNGVAGTRLPDFDRKLSTTATQRNWRTVCKLLDMTCNRV
jgi:uncharacterized protein (DUF1697 family)